MDEQSKDFDEFVAKANDRDIWVQVKTLKTLTTLASEMMAEDIKTKLFPFLRRYVMTPKSQSVWVTLLKQLEDLVFIVEVENVKLIFDIFETIATSDFSSVRQAVVYSITQAAKHFNDSQVEDILVPFTLKLGYSSDYSLKCSASSLCLVCYKKVGDCFKAELIRLMKILCEDVYPMVRLTACVSLRYFLDELETRTKVEEFLQIFTNLCNNTNDSFRVIAVDVAIKIGMHLYEEEVRVFLLPSLIKLSNDISWKVRCKIAHQLPDILEAMGWAITREYIGKVLNNMVKDHHCDVREAITRNLIKISEYLHKNFQDGDDGDDECDPIIINNILPLINHLYNDSTMIVKEILSEVVISMLPLVGEENWKVLVTPMLKIYFIEDSCRIKGTILSNIEEIVRVIGYSKDVSNVIFDIMLDLMNSSSANWRTRREVVCAISCISHHIDSTMFDNKLKILYIKLLEDRVYAVRRTATLILPRLVKLFGTNWASVSLLPSIFLFSEDKNYLLRFVYLFCIDELVLPTLDSRKDQNIFAACTEADNNSEGIISNVLKLHGQLVMELEKEWIKKCLEENDHEQPPGELVQTYAEDALIRLNQQEMSISQITCKEILNPQEVYLEEILKLILSNILKVLENLSKDLVCNIRIKSAQTLHKIVFLSKLLEEDVMTFEIDDLTDKEEGSTLKNEESVSKVPEESEVDSKTEETIISNL